MEIDRDDLREVVSYFLHRLCEMEEELVAHQVLVRWSRREPRTADAMDLLLEHARRSAALPRHLQEICDQQLENLADSMVGALEAQSTGKQPESLQSMAARRARLIN